LPAEKQSSTPPSIVADRKPDEPSRLEKFYHERAARNPKDVEALEGMAILQVQRGDYAQAIASYYRVLDLTPNDHDAKVGLGRALAFSGQYDAALGKFQALLQERPGDTDALEGLARVQAWAGHPSAALPIFQHLAAHYPANPEYAVGLARVQMNLHQYPEARKTLTALLTAHPRDRDAQMQLAYLDLFEGHQAAALRRFNHLISEDPTDAEALQGNARIAYYRGDLKYARDLTAKLVDDNPSDVAALLLLAHLERALHNPQRCRALLYRLQALDPRNPEVLDLEKSLHSDSRPTLHTSASFAREIVTGSPSSAEDLSTMGYETTWGFAAVPRSESSVSLVYLPSQSPSGGTQGAVGPSEIFFRHSTFVTPQLTVRSGWGVVRFGPGDLAGIPTQEQPIVAARMRLLGFGGFTYAWRKKLTLDFTAARSAVTYTPTAVRLGVMEDRLSVGLDYRLNTRTDLHFNPFVTDDFTIPYHHEASFVTSTAALADHNRARGASFAVDRKVLHWSALAVDLGYDGLAYQLEGHERPYLGMFDPSFYQRHYLTTHLVGKIHGPLGYDFSAGAGIQQIEFNTPIKPAMLLSPAFTLRTSPRLSLTLGYTYYNNSQSLGTLRGNGVRLATDWKF
jgi:tetratricopeptide (TPR) repeat protein